MLVDNDFSYRRLDHRIFLCKPSPMYTIGNQLEQVGHNGGSLYQYEPDVPRPSMVRRDYR